MKKEEIKYLDQDYILLRDKVIRYLLNYDLLYSLYDNKKIKKTLKLLLKLLEKGE